MCLFVLNEGVCGISFFGCMYFMTFSGWFIIDFLGHVFMYVMDDTWSNFSVTVFRQCGIFVLYLGD